MNFTNLIREVGARVLSPVHAFSILFVICLLTIAGPFGTFEFLSLIERAIYWGFIVLFAVLIVETVKVLVLNTFPNLSYWQNGALVSAIFTTVYCPILVYWEHYMFDWDHLHIVSVWTLFLVVFGISMAIVQIRYLLQPGETASRARLFERFSDNAVTKIYRVTVRDHYVDVFTDRGTETLLMRFSDALAELDGINGLQVHRSHWVACEAMLRLDRSDGRYLLVVKDGGKVPVSRSHRIKVEARLADGAASESPTVLTR